LGVGPDVLPDDLRRAYKRTALRVHPDKGGRVEDFQEVQRAYSILNDPYQKKMYDLYGEEMVMLLEGNGGPEAVATIFSRLSVLQRGQLVLLFFTITSFFMLTPIFITLRWDLHIDWPWVACFVPLWVLHSLACVPVVLVPSPPEDMGEEEREEWEASIEAQTKMRITAFVIMGLLLILEIFVALRLEGEIEWSWHTVLLPWALLEFLAVVRKIYVARRTEMNDKFPNVGWNVVRLAMAFTVAAKMNGHISSWDMTFIPCFIGLGVSFCMLTWQCCSPPTQTDDEVNPRTAACSGCCGLLFLAIWVGLVLWRLDDPEEVTAIVTMIPLFVPPYLFCCCLSCVVCFAYPEVNSDFEEPLVKDEYGHADRV